MCSFQTGRSSSSLQDNIETAVALQMHSDAQRQLSRAHKEGAIESPCESGQQSSENEISEPRQSRAMTASTVDDAEDWEIKPADLQICRLPDGRPFELGSGAFGKVRFVNDFILKTFLTDLQALPKNKRSML